MHWPWSRAKHKAVTPFVVREREAYASIEEARLWCEELVRRRSAGSDKAVLTALHREIGMAGLHASHHLRAERRRTMLAQAHARTAQRIDASQDGVRIGSLGVLIDQALERVQPALGVEGLCDEMEEAHRRLLSARELLVAARAEPRRLTPHR